MASTEKECFLCGTMANHADNPSVPGMTIVWCNCCGIYKIVGEVVSRMGEASLLADESTKRRLSGVIRENYEIRKGQDTPILLPSNIKDFLSRAPDAFDVPGKVRKLLSALGRRSCSPGSAIEISSETDVSLAYASSQKEFFYLSNYAKDLRWIEVKELRGTKSEPQVAGKVGPDTFDWTFLLTPTGWEELARANRTDSIKAFIAMWFNDELNPAYTDGIAPACERCGFRAVRIDGEEFNGDILDQIIAEIRESRFAVCDLTRHRKGVYFEAGYAMGLGIPVIWTCRDDEAENTHFDAEHFNQIRWQTPEELQSKLANRIRATIGYGPHSAPIPEGDKS